MSINTFDVMLEIHWRLEQWLGTYTMVRLSNATISRSSLMILCYLPVCSDDKDNNGREEEEEDDDEQIHPMRRIDSFMTSGSQHIYHAFCWSYSVISMRITTYSDGFAIKTYLHQQFETLRTIRSTKPSTDMLIYRISCFPGQIRWQRLRISELIWYRKAID